MGRSNREEREQKAREAKDRHIIYQYTMDGEFVKEWSSEYAASRETGLTGIRQCLAGRSRRCGGYVWKWKVPHAPSKYWRQGEYGKRDKAKQVVVQCDLDGKPIREWWCASAAGRALGLSTTVQQCLYGIRRTAGGFMWKYKVPRLGFTFSDHRGIIGLKGNNK